MTWYAFKGYNNGQAIDASAFDAAELNATGMHGYPTQAEAQANPNSVSWFQVVLVNAAIDDYNNARDISPTQANNPTSLAAPVQAAANTAGSAASGLLGNITAGITGFSGTNFVLRAIKVIIGGVLLLIGLAHITGADNAISDAARKAPLPV